MRYQLVVFDMDGTILDTLEDLKNAVNHALAIQNFPLRSLEEVRGFVGNGMWKLIRRAVPNGTDEETIQRVHDDFMEYYHEHCADCTKPYAGIVPLIRRLKKAGCKTAVISNKADAAVHELCDRFFSDCFDCEIGAREGIANKPAPDSVYEVIRRFEMEPRQTVYVGDSEVDIATARNAGVDGIAVSWGFRPVSFLQEQGAEVILEDTLAVGDYILSENYGALLANIRDMIVEQQLKLGYRKEMVRLYYPLSSLNRFLGTEHKAREMEEELHRFASALAETYGEFLIDNLGTRFCIGVSETGAEYIHSHAGDTSFLRGLLDLVSLHGTAMEDVIAHFRSYAKDVQLVKSENGEFDYLLYFGQGKPDDYRYCFSLEGEHIIYHRYTREDYEDFGF